MDIAETSSLLTRRQYSTSLFDHIVNSPPNLNVTSLIHPLFALTQLQGLNPQEISYRHLSTLFQERTDDNPGAVRTLEQACERLEADYEATESPRSLGRFMLAKADLARSYLATGRFAHAVESGKTALSLSSDASSKELDAEQRRKARLSAHLTVGVAEYFRNRASDAVEYLEKALAESGGNPDAVCVLAQILWATDTEDARDQARTALFDVIERDPSHVQSVLLLGVIALLDEDDESLDAVVSELHALRTGDGLSDADHARIGEVLRAVAASSSQDDDAAVAVAVLTQVQNDILLNPHLPHGWSRLAEAAGDADNNAAEMALNVALKAIPPRGELDALDLARSYAGTTKAADAQKALMLAPWDSGGWESLAGVAVS